MFQKLHTFRIRKSTQKPDFKGAESVSKANFSVPEEKLKFGWYGLKCDFLKGLPKKLLFQNQLMSKFVLSYPDLFLIFQIFFLKNGKVF
jgi:hypothetical protein